MKHLVQQILAVGGMLTRRSRTNDPYKKLENFLGGIWWPSTIGRVPAKVSVLCERQTHSLTESFQISGSLKADQWRNLATVLPVALYCAWQQNGEIPDRDSPKPRPSSKAGAAFTKTVKLLRDRRKAFLKHVARQSGQTLEAEDLKDDAILPDRNYQRHFKTILDACAAIRIWTTQSITPDEARRAQEYHARAC